jgi:hypothetical protein
MTRCLFSRSRHPEQIAAEHGAVVDEIENGEGGMKAGRSGKG